MPLPVIIGTGGFLGDTKYFVVNTSDGNKAIANSSVNIKDKNTGQILASGVTNQSGGIRFPMTQFPTLNNLEVQISSAGYKNFRVDVNPKAGFQTYWAKLEPRNTTTTTTTTTTTGGVTTGGGDDKDKDKNKVKFSIKNMRTGFVLAGIAGIALLIIAFTASSKKQEV
jgi:hypothetical protein